MCVPGMPCRYEECSFQTKGRYTWSFHGNLYLASGIKGQEKMYSLGILEFEENSTEYIKLRLTDKTLVL